jgi:hypothetical protein
MKIGGPCYCIAVAGTYGGFKPCLRGNFIFRWVTIEGVRRRHFELMKLEELVRAKQRNKGARCECLDGSDSRLSHENESRQRH